MNILGFEIKSKEEREQEERERQRIHRLQASYPGMKLWRKIDLRDFGGSRQIRFGHLTGTEEWQIVIPQHRSGWTGIPTATSAV
mgnify:CR=1 FL=1